MLTKGLQSGWGKLKGIVSLPEAPHAIALGTAIGLLFTFTPTPGLQTLVAFGLAALLRASKAAALAMVWISNPFTAAPMYAASYAVGCYIVPWADIFTTTVIGGLLIGAVCAGISYPLVYRLVDARNSCARRASIEPA